MKNEACPVCGTQMIYSLESCVCPVCYMAIELEQEGCCGGCQCDVEGDGEDF